MKNLFVCLSVFNLVFRHKCYSDFGPERKSFLKAFLTLEQNYKFLCSGVYFKDQTSGQDVTGLRKQHLKQHCSFSTFLQFIDL